MFMLTTQNIQYYLIQGPDGLPVNNNSLFPLLSQPCLDRFTFLPCQLVEQFDETTLDQAANCLTLIFRPSESIADPRFC